MNVVWITVDSLRADFIDYYKICRLPDDLKHHRKTTLTPNIDSLCEQSCVFTQAFANGVDTGHCNPAMLSSTYPLDYGGVQRLSKKRIILPEILKQNGYHCYGFNSNPWISSFFGYNRGFEHYYDDIKYGGRKTSFTRMLRWLSKPYLEAEKLNQQMFDFGDQMQEPFFLWVYYMDVHVPYRVEGIPGVSNVQAKYWITKVQDRPSDRLKKNLLNAYQTGVSCVDRAIGELLEYLQSKKLMENTVTLLNADHGEKFWEHGTYGHAGVPYDEVIHIPFLIQLPKDGDSKAKKHQQVDGLVSHLDILPTILDLLGIKSQRIVEGESLVPILYQKKSKPLDERMITVEGWVNNVDDMQLCLRTKKWKYIIHKDRRELYDLENDSKEQNNCVKEHPAVMVEFEKILQKRAQQYLDKTKKVLTTTTQKLKTQTNS